MGETHRRYLDILHRCGELEQDGCRASEKTRQRIKREINNYELLLAEHQLFTAVTALDPSQEAPSQNDHQPDEDASSSAEKPFHDEEFSNPGKFGGEKSPLVIQVERADETELLAWPNGRPLFDEREEEFNLMLQLYHDKYKRLSLMYGAPIAMPFQKAWHVQFEMGLGKEGIDFGRMQEIADVHHCVVHGTLSHHMGVFALQDIESRPPRRGLLFRLFGYGLLSMAIGFIAFEEQPADMVPTFVLGILLGFMQLVMAPASATLSNLFPFMAAFCLTIMARVVGAIRWRGLEHFCWPAIASGSLANILPSYAILIAAIELQGASTTTGSIQLISSLAYTFMLSFGILCGSNIFGEHSPSKQESWR